MSFATALRWREAKARYRRWRNQVAPHGQMRGVIGVGDGSLRTWSNGGPPLNDAMYVRLGRGFEDDGLTPTQPYNARNLSLHEFAEGDPVTLEWMGSGRGGGMYKIVYRERRGTLALYWIGYQAIPAVWQLYRLLPDGVTLEVLGKPADWADYEMSQAGLLFTIRGAVVVGGGTSGIAGFRLWMPGSGWQVTPAPFTPGSTSWGQRRNVRLAGDLYTIRGEIDAGDRYIRIWRLSGLPATWTLVVSQRCEEMTDIEAAWPVEAPVVQTDPLTPAYIAVATISNNFSPLAHSEGRVFWRLRLPTGADLTPLVNQYNPLALMPLSSSPYNMSIRRRVTLDYFMAPDGETPWFVGSEADDFVDSLNPVPFLPIATRYDRAADAWVDQGMTWTKAAPAQDPGFYHVDPGYRWQRDPFTDGSEDIAFAPVAPGEMYATMDGGFLPAESHSGGHTEPDNTLWSAAPVAAHYGPSDASGGLPTKRFVRQRPGAAAAILASMTIPLPDGSFDDSFGFHGVAVQADGTILFGIGKSGNFGTAALALTHPIGGYPAGGIYYAAASGAILPWPPLQTIFNGAQHGALRLYVSEDEV